ncbi:MAG: FAD-binding and (Fe-S)-binding domain-containing protein [Myxococcota bacterium]
MALAKQLPEGTVSWESADRLAVATDLWPRHMLGWAAGHCPPRPAAVVWPENTAELVSIVHYAQEHGIGLVPYGAGSSVVGGASADAEHLVVDLKRMQRVRRIDGQARAVTAETGVMGELLERQINRLGYTLGHFPSSIYCSTLGGWIAARSAGQMSSVYGKIEDQILGGVVVLGDGRLVHQPLSPIKSTMLSRLIGSEGCLGIWSQATLRIHPLPGVRLLRGLEFPDLRRALECARRWMAEGLRPSVVRIYDPLDSFLHRTNSVHVPHERGPSRLAWLGANFPKTVASFVGTLTQRCTAILVLEGEGQEPEASMKQALGIARILGGRDQGAGPGEVWWANRYKVSYRQSNAFRAGVMVDTMEVACLWDVAWNVYAEVRRVALELGVQVLTHFSHVYLEGCSLYFTFAMPMRFGESGYARLWQVCLDAAVGAGANVSHHHGLGRLKGGAFKKHFSAQHRALQTLRRSWDPHAVLNPGNFEGNGLVTETRSVEFSALDARASSFLCAARVEESVGNVEQRLRRSGRTLGVAADFLPNWTCLSAARQGLLWGDNAQLRTIEPLVVGCDGDYRGKPVRYRGAPRHAMGPEVSDMLLSGDVSRLWLRTAPRRTRTSTWHITGRAEEVILFMMAVARRSTGVLLHPIAQFRGGQGMAQVCSTTEDSSETVEAALLVFLKEGTLRAFQTDDEGVPPLRGQMVVLSGGWQAWRQALASGELSESSIIVGWSEVTGAVGFAHDMTRAQHDLLLTVAERYALLGACEVIPVTSSLMFNRAAPPELLNTDDNTALNINQDDSAVPKLHLSATALSSHAAALANCTYCPKLCRFSCPVAVSSGSEALTPRQLMLTVELERRQIESMSADVAKRLWSCVDCGGCRSYCDHDNDVASALQDARAVLFKQGRAPQALGEYLGALLRRGVPLGFSEQDDPRTLLQLTSSCQIQTTQLFIGCKASRRDLTTYQGSLELLRESFDGVGVVQGGPRCCGHPLWRWGDVEGFAKHAARVQAASHGARRWIVDDPGCAYAMRHLYPRVGVEMPDILTLWDCLHERPLRREPEEPWTPFEACFSTRMLGESSMRQTLTPRVRGMVAGTVLQPEAGCCGGMLLDAYDRHLADTLGNYLADDCRGAGAQRVLSGSPTCRRRLRAAGLQVDDIAMLWVPRY